MFFDCRVRDKPENQTLRGRNLIYDVKALALENHFMLVIEQGNFIYSKFRVAGFQLNYVTWSRKTQSSNIAREKNTQEFEEKKSK